MLRAATYPGIAGAFADQWGESDAMTDMFVEAAE
jgi:hypothetical protein